MNPYLPAIRKGVVSYILNDSRLVCLYTAISWDFCGKDNISRDSEVGNYIMWAFTNLVCLEKWMQKRSYGKYAWNILMNTWMHFMENWILIFLLIDETIKIILKRGLSRSLQLQGGYNSMLLSILKKNQNYFTFENKGLCQQLNHFLVMLSYTFLWKNSESIANYVNCLSKHEFHLFKNFDFMLKFKQVAFYLRKLLSLY